MNESSSGKPAKRKIEPDNLGEPEKKMAQKYSRSKRGLFKTFTHLYPDEKRNEYLVLLTSPDEINLNFLKVNNSLKSVPGVLHIKMASPKLVKVLFHTNKTANDFVLNQALMKKFNWSAKIPSNALECQGIIRVPLEISEEDLLEHLKSSSDIIGVKRFQKRQSDGSFSPMSTVLLTFLSSTKPDHVTFDHMWFDVQNYVRPLLQCFVCYGFGHGRSSCKRQQVCSICAGNHFFKDCNNTENIKCINCSGSHAAVSNHCPKKAEKLAQVRNRIMGVSYASVTAKSKDIETSTLSQASNPSINSITYNKSHSTSNVTPHKRALALDILNSDMVLNALTKTVIELVKLALDRKESQDSSSLNSPSPPPNNSISSRVIKELLITNFSNIQ